MVSLGGGVPLRANTLLIVFIMPNTCKLGEGKYYISTNGICVGLHKDPNALNVVVNGQKTPFYLKKTVSGQNCTYQITTQSGGKGFIRHDKEWINVSGNRQEWVITNIYDDVYTVALKEDHECGWIDPVTDYERQLQLHHPLNPYDCRQQFRITRN